MLDFSYLKESDKGIRHILVSLLVLGLLIYTVFFFIHVIQQVQFPYDLDNGEGFILNQAAEYSIGNIPYTSIDEYPFKVSNYPPVYPLLIALGIKIGGLSFFYGRFISVLASFGCALFVYLWIARHTERKLPALIAALSLLSSYYFYVWGGLHRVDALALFFTLGGLYLVEREKPLTWVVLFFSLAFLTRQTNLAGPLAATYYLFKIERKRDALKLILSFAILNGLFILIMNSVTGGEYYKHLFVYNKNAFRVGESLLFQLHLLRFYAPIVAIGIFFLIWEWSGKRINLLVPYLILAWGTSLTAGKIGSAPNYFFEFYAALCLALGFVWAEADFMNNSEGKWARVLLPLILICHLFQAFHYPSPRYAFDKTPTQMDLEQKGAIVDYLEKVKGPVFTEDGGLTLLAGKTIYFQPFIMTQLSKQNWWDQTPVLNWVKKKKFGAVVTLMDAEKLIRNNPNRPIVVDRYTDEFIRTLNFHYYLFQQIGSYRIYLPKYSMAPLR